MPRLFTLLLCCLAALPVRADSEWDHARTALTETVEIRVLRSPDCQCCHAWIVHLEQHGFHVLDELRHDMEAIKRQVGLPPAMASCHTALVDGYLVEGHVPADDIKRMLLQRPDIRGLSVPQMPVGTPGMEMGARKDDFAVIGFDDSGDYRIFNRYRVGADGYYHAEPPQD